MQVSLGNEKSLRKRSVLGPFTKTFLVPQWYLHRKNKIPKCSALDYPYLNPNVKFKKKIILTHPLEKLLILFHI